MINEIPEATKILRQTMREFAESEIAPHVLEWDEAQRFPMELIPKLAELGVMGAVIPAEYGGSELSYPEYVAVIEELSRVDGSIGLFAAAHNSLCLNHIFSAGSEEQKRRFLPALASGKKIGAWGLTEAGAGSDAGGTRTTAVRDGDAYILNGSKNFITNASIADSYVLMAVTNRDRKDHGISAFIVERGTPGFFIGKKENKLGLRASDTASITLEDCRLPSANLLGAEGEGFIDSLRVLDGGRISIAALAVGMAQGAYEHSIKYAKERRQFGKAIAEFQAIQFKLADMATEIEAARLLTLKAAELKQQGRPTTKESSMAKLFSGEVAVRVANEAVQIHGGYGFIKDFPVEKYYRDVKLCTIGEGTSEIQRIVISRQILK
ncbi:MAG TPA: acyl-CoA dehydrogenase [Acidobacteriota bacterium]|nr:acyl-CoA dehydrogenase [Acidobacteriota bacterium]